MPSTPRSYTSSQQDAADTARHFLGFILILPCVFFAAEVAQIEISAVGVCGLHVFALADYTRFLSGNMVAGQCFRHPHIYAIFICCALIGLFRLTNHDWIKTAQIMLGFASLFWLLVAVYLDVVYDIYGPFSVR